MFSEKGQIPEGVFLVGWKSRRGESDSVTKWRDKDSEVGSGVGRLIGCNRGTYDESGPSVRMRGNVWNNCLR